MLCATLALVTSVLGEAAAEVPPKAERMAAWRYSIVSVDETRPNAALLTYVRDRDTDSGALLLAKVLTSVETGGQRITTDAATHVRVSDFPGGVRAEFSLGAIEVTCEHYPLHVPDLTARGGGAFLYRVATSPPAPVVLTCGGGRELVLRESRDYVRSAALDAESDVVVRPEADCAVLTSPRQPYPVCLRTSGALETAATDRIEARLDTGSGWALLTFADTPDAAKAAAASLDPETARNVVVSYYEGLLRACRVETPDEALDAAFSAALYNLEYNWLDDPACWIECIHHWLSAYHMEHTAAAEWIGQKDRSRRATLAQLENLLGSGLPPSFYPSGHGRQVFGGTEHFLARQIDHYWRFTADRDFIERAAGPYRTVIEATRAKHDADGDGLFSWEAQVGNQEDYVHHPYASAGATIEWTNMLRVQLSLAEAISDDDTAALCRSRLDRTSAALRERLWKRDLGRFIYYVDPLGSERLDGPYYTYTHALLWGVVDPTDGWTGLRHFRDRLCEPDGRFFVSNAFPMHIIGPGMQASAVQQPWGARALAAAGLGNEAWRPLKAVADWVTNDFHRGAFMEHNEMWPEIAYFSPAAALYIQATVEAIFGLQMDAPNCSLGVSPCFPYHWPQARLVLPEFSVEYRREANALHYSVETAAPLARRIRWLLPPCRVSDVRVDGSTVPHEVRPHVGCIELAFDTAPTRRSAIEVAFQPLGVRIDAPGSVAQGDPFSLRVDGCRITGIEDRAGVLADARIIGPDSLRATVAEGLLDRYLTFGNLGLLNFSRRTFFLTCEAGEGVAWQEPVTIAVLPRYELAPAGEVHRGDSGWSVRFVVRNNTSTPLIGPGELAAAGGIATVDLRVPPRSEQTCSVDLSRAFAEGLSAGDNHFELVLPNGARAATVVTAPGGPRPERPGDDCRTATDRVELQTAEVEGSPRHVQLPLPEADLVPDTEWRRFVTFRAGEHPPWSTLKPPLEGCPMRIRLEGYPYAALNLAGRDFVPVSHRGDRPEYTFELGGRACRKINLLLLPFVDNHAMFAPIAAVTVNGSDGPIVSRTLYLPGDLDWCFPVSVSHYMATVSEQPRDRFGLLPLLPPDRSDWAEGAPLLYAHGSGFPQRRYWTNARHYVAPNATLDLIEIPLPRPAPVESLTVRTVGVGPALGLVAVSVELGP